MPIIDNDLPSSGSLSRQVQHLQHLHQPTDKQCGYVDREGEYQCIGQQLMATTVMTMYGRAAGRLGVEMTSESLCNVISRSN